MITLKEFFLMLYDVKLREFAVKCNELAKVPYIKAQLHSTVDYTKLIEQQSGTPISAEKGHQKTYTNTYKDRDQRGYIGTFRNGQDR